eukprot:3683608-Lingulodinium_polyedra.AAC.1
MLWLPSRAGGLAAPNPISGPSVPKSAPGRVPCSTTRHTASANPNEPNLAQHGSQLTDPNL